MSELIRIPFRSCFRDLLLSGEKTCTARTGRMGEPGDVFEAFDAKFELLSVQQVYLHEVASRWKEEGCMSREHFIEVWKSIHPRAGYRPYQLVQLHTFRRINDDIHHR